MACTQACWRHVLRATFTMHGALLSTLNIHLSRHNKGRTSVEMHSQAELPHKASSVICHTCTSFIPKEPLYHERPCRFSTAFYGNEFDSARQPGLMPFRLVDLDLRFDSLC
jgi:hypothetical protein